MKKASLYIILGILLCVGLLSLLPKSKRVSTYISLNKKDKNPYGAFVFHESLKKFFHNAELKINYSNPGNNKVFGDYKPHQLYVILHPKFTPNSQDVDDLITFIERGNNVFISSFFINHEFYRFVKATSQSRNYESYPYGGYESDTMQTQLLAPSFGAIKTYQYPGIDIESYFKRTDSNTSKILGLSNNGEPNFIHLKKGAGNLYIHLSPLTFSNYFLLYKNNSHYFEQIFSQFPSTTPLIIWDEYFAKQHNTNQNQSWFIAILKNPYFKAGVLTALIFLLLYVLTETRRRQRVIPIIQRPSNDSLDFVKTMGLLYYERGDHTNLAQKISAYFLEHVRSRYKIFAKNMDSGFIKELSYKSGVNELLVENIVSQINRINNKNIFSDTELIALQNNVDEFYNNE